MAKGRFAAVGTRFNSRRGERESAPGFPKSERAPGRSPPNQRLVAGTAKIDIRGKAQAERPSYREGYPRERIETGSPPRDDANYEGAERGRKRSSAACRRLQEMDLPQQNELVGRASRLARTGAPPDTAHARRESKGIGPAQASAAHGYQQDEVYWKNEP